VFTAGGYLGNISFSSHIDISFANRAKTFVELHHLPKVTAILDFDTQHVVYCPLVELHYQIPKLLNHPHSAIQCHFQRQYHISETALLHRQWLSMQHSTSFFPDPFIV